METTVDNTRFEYSNIDMVDENHYAALVDMSKYNLSDKELYKMIHSDKIKSLISINRFYGEQGFDRWDPMTMDINPLFSIINIFDISLYYSCDVDNTYGYDVHFELLKNRRINRDLEGSDLKEFVLFPRIAFKVVNRIVDNQRFEEFIEPRLITFDLYRIGDMKK